jgi:Na+/glutamate symporter
MSPPAAQVGMVVGGIAGGFVGDYALNNIGLEVRTIRRIPPA